MSSTRIHHIIVMPSDLKEENFTFFQGFSREVAGDYINILSCLSMVPHDVMETRFDSQSLVRSRLGGASLDVNHVNESLLDERHVDVDSCFTFVWSTASTIDSAKKACKLFRFPPIHISCSKNDDVIFIGDVDDQKIVEEIEKLRAIVINSHPDRSFSEYLNAQPSEPKSEVSIDFRPMMHNCTVPSVKALVACGYEFKELVRIDPSPNIDQHISNIVDLAKIIDDQRSQVLVPDELKKNDVIVCCSSIYAHLYKANSNAWNALYRTLGKPEREIVKNILIRNKGYSNYGLELESKDETDPMSHPVVSMLVNDRKIELRIFTEILSVLAANQFCAVVRFPNAVMLHHDQLRNIASLAGSSSSHKKRLSKLNKKLRAYSDALISDLGDDLVDISFSNRRKLLAVCDFPIEWVTVDCFPLMFTHEISRIFPTPGNMLGVSALRSPRLMLPYSLFKDVLVIRSFQSRDPIKDCLSRAISIFEDNGSYKNLDIQVVDVSTEKELITCLNDFHGSVAIFDCHGGHGGESENAWLHIGQERVDVWTLANKCRIPPIIILSACSTHPIDGSHASVANGFFRCGAMSVLGTYAPVHAIHSAQFVARILFRISAFLPIILEGRCISWREMLSGLFRMSYVTDVTMGMARDLELIDDQTAQEIQVNANEIINAFTPMWQDAFFNLLVEKTGIESGEMEQLLKQNFQFVETMLYSQLGRPENILICSDEG